MARWLPVAVLAFALGGCAARGYDRGQVAQTLKEKLVRDSPATPKELEVTDAAILLALETKPQVAPPFRLGIHLDPTAGFTPEEKDRIIAWGDKLKAEGIVSDFFLVPESILPGRDWDSGYYSPANLRRVRLGAARLQADVVLDVRVQFIDDDYPNFWSIFYPTIAGCWLAPGSHKDTLFVMSAGVWDVRNEYIYAWLESEGVATTVRPVVFRSDLLTHPPARKEALDFFETEFFRRLRNLKAR